MPPSGLTSNPGPAGYAASTRGRRGPRPVAWGGAGGGGPEHTPYRHKSHVLPQIKGMLDPCCAFR